MTRALAATVALVVAITACGTGVADLDPPTTGGLSETGTRAIATADTSTRGPRPSPNPVAMSATLDDGARVVATIGPDGGSLVAALAGGSTATLTIPEGALLSDEEITMTPIASASSDVLGEMSITGVKLEPEGLRLLRMAELRLEGPQVGADWVGIAADGSGGDVHLVPNEPASGSSVIALNHFSVYAVVQSVEALLKNRPPSSAEAYWEQELADADLYGENFKYVLETFADWGRDLRSRLGNAASVETTVEQLSGELLSFLDRLWQRADAYYSTLDVANAKSTIDQLLNRVGYSEIIARWISLLGKVVDRHSMACKGAAGPAAGIQLLKWGVVLGVVEQDIVNQDILGQDIPYPASDFTVLAATRLGECLTFNVNWTAEGRESNETLQRTWKGAAHASATVSVGSNGVSGELIVDSWTEESPLDALFACTPELEPGLAVMGVALDMKIPNPGGLAAAALEGFRVTLRREDDAQIKCQELPGANNQWRIFGQWLDLDDEDSGRGRGSESSFNVPVDKTAIPPASQGWLETTKVLETFGMGDASVRISQTLIVQHNPGGASN